MNDPSRASFNIVQYAHFPVTEQSLWGSPSTAFVGTTLPTDDHSVPPGEYLTRQSPWNSVPSGNLPLMNTLLSARETKVRSWSLVNSTLMDSMKTLAAELNEVTAKLQHLQRMRTFVVPLTTLAPTPLQMLQQIPVTIEGDGEEFTATFTEANVSASGETEADAIANFKESLLTSYLLFESMPPDKLGPIPTRQWEILKSVAKLSE